ncbi:hypothetical protein [Streptomyces sp. NPDC047097]|uniref:hypothetical protein n=1 Tax=Streptomyces sp. NPDC047097 TaxID=3155260 RepID=UPI0033FEAE83
MRDHSPHSSSSETEYYSAQEETPLASSAPRTSSAPGLHQQPQGPASPVPSTPAPPSPAAPAVAPAPAAPPVRGAASEDSYSLAERGGVPRAESGPARTSGARKTVNSLLDVTPSVVSATAEWTRNPHARAAGTWAGIARPAYNIAEQVGYARGVRNEPDKPQPAFTPSKVAANTITGVGLGVWGRGVQTDSPTLQGMGAGLVAAGVLVNSTTDQKHHEGNPQAAAAGTRLPGTPLRDLRASSSQPSLQPPADRPAHHPAAPGTSGGGNRLR